jgi:hypothetical protein
VRTELRLDAMRLDARRIRRDSRGFIVAAAAVTRTGVFEYRRSDGSVVRELRHPDHVFAPDHLDSLRGASVTIGHPIEGSVSPSNARKLEVGVVSDARRDGRFVAASLSIREAAAIARVERTELVELSCGYSCRIDPTPGVFEGERYDQAQVSPIVVNHVALLGAGQGRAGRDVRLRFDSASSVVMAAASTFYGERRDGTMSQQNEIISISDEQQKRFDAAIKKLEDAGIPEGTASRHDRNNMSLEERLEAAERRLRQMGGGR